MIQNITNICAVTVALLSLVVTYIIFYKNTSPEVIAYLKTGKDKAKSVIYLEIKNIGNDFARDFEIYIDSKIEALTKLQDIKIEFPFFQP